MEQSVRVIMMRYKHKGVTLAATAIAIVAWMFLGYISFIVMASPFSVLAAVRTARQAEQYAEFVANSLKLVDYSELGTAAHARRSLTGEISGAAGWESRVAIGAEQQIGSNPDNLQRIATIDIFQTGDTLSRYTLQVPLSSAGSGGSGVIGIPDYSKAQNLGTPNVADLTEVTYTMPDDGWFFYKYVGPDTQWGKNASLKVNGVLLNASRVFGTHIVCELDGLLPVKKGDKVSICGIYTNIRSNDYGGSPFQGSVHRAWSAFFIPNRK